MSRWYPTEKRLTARDLEFYAQGMWDLYVALGGDPHCKRYDPLTFEDGAALSYVLYFRDGGRSHIVYNYDEMAQDVLAEFMEMFKEEFWDTLKWEGTKSGTKSGT